MTKDAEFQEVVWNYYAKHGRTMPWRTDHTPYNVLVSELMLQQTQVNRVIPKFAEFMAQFSDVRTLADSPLSSVLQVWQGLGYNRRAKYLHDAAKMIRDEMNGAFPATSEGLLKLPGVGKNTAGAIMAYAYDAPAVFIETNIRTVYFHHFYEDSTSVTDTELAEVVKRTLPEENYREWYWALMDYGSNLKRLAGGRLEVSKHYKKQSPLKGSVREVRGQIVAALSYASTTEIELRTRLVADERFGPALDGLIADGLVTKSGPTIGLTA